MSKVIYPAWFVVQTKQNQERKAESSLVSQGVECYLPVVEQPAIQYRNKFHGDILFPRYLFAFFDPEVIHTTKVKNTRGVAGIVNFGGVPAILSKSQMADIRKEIDHNIFAEMANFIPVRGEPVEITSGIFESLSGIYEEPDGMKRSMVLIELLGQQIHRSVSNKDFQFISS